MKIAAIDIINSKNRNSTVDIFRGIAILLVVLCHFSNTFFYGYVGVDLFFVISGLLVGGLLVRKFNSIHSINFTTFFLQRGLKIWPSYFIFLLLGIPISYLLFAQSNPEQLISLSELPKYIFFYKNYSVQPFHLVFDQIWSLCIEEHFYIMLPIVFIILKYFNIGKNGLFATAFFFILSGIVSKIFMNHSSSLGTHARIDALGWGVLLSLVQTYYPLKIKKQYLLSVFGLIILSTLIFTRHYYNTSFYERVIYHSTLPISFFLMIIGLYNYNLKSFKLIRLIGYYSYNWYLWHPMFHVVIANEFGEGFIPMLGYLLLSFSVAVFFTIVVEEKFLSYRTKIINILPTQV